MAVSLPHLKIPDVAHLLGGAVVPFNMPVLAMLLGERFPVKGRKPAFIGQANSVMAWLV